MAVSRSAIAVLCLVALVAAGCDHNKATTGGSGGTTQPSTTKPAGTIDNTGWMLHKAAKLPPFVFLENPGTIRIDDVTAGKTVLQTAISASTLITVQPVDGIKLGQDTKVKGPLPAGHQYAVWWKP